MSHEIYEDVSTSERLRTSDDSTVNLVLDFRALGHRHVTLWKTAEDSKKLTGRTVWTIYRLFLDVRKFILSDVYEGDEDIFAEDLGLRDNKPESTRRRKTVSLFLGFL